MKSRFALPVAAGVLVGALLTYGAHRIFSGQTALATPGNGIATTILARGVLSNVVLGQPTTSVVTRKIRIKTKSGFITRTIRIKVPSIQKAIDCTNSCDTAFQQAVIQPGGSAGWHTHPGATFVAVSQGELTYFHVSGGTCVSHKITPGSGFFQMPTEVHNARNEGSVPFVLYTLYVLPSGTPNSGIRIDQPQPAGC